YFSSHGSPSDIDVGGVNYLVAHDTDPKNLFITGIAMQDLARIIKGRVQAQRIVLLLDACHSGVVAPSSKGLQRVCNVDPDKVVQGTGQLVITSSMPSQRSWESSRYKGSVFTKHLIDGLRKDGINTNLGEAFNYLESQVQREVLRDRGLLQTPVMKSKWSGNELIIGVPPTNPSTGLPTVELPDNLSAENKKAQATPSSSNANTDDAASSSKSMVKKNQAKSKKKKKR
ncbi:MAG TPA: caspase family protein, partial [Candidatus Melainabacteria bacterium]|nr:caspase family protein [Candidatus Melainabacteria bacterium]